MPGSNPNLEPEKGDVWTIGYNTSIGDKTEFSVSAYYSDIDNAITDNGLKWNDPGLMYVNAKKEKRRGMEVVVNHEFDEHFTGHLSYTYMQIKQDLGNGFERDTKEKPNTYRAGLKYKNADWIYNADLTAVSGQKVRVGGYYGYTDSNYFVLDLGAQYKVKENLKVFANIYNVTNARYQEMGGIFDSSLGNLAGEAYYPMPSRSFIIGAEYTF